MQAGTDGRSMRKSGILIGIAVLCAGASLAVVVPGDEPEVQPYLPGQDALTPAAEDGAAATSGRRLVETAAPSPELPE